MGRKVSERERLTMWARNASDDELDQAGEILRIEQRARSTKPKATKTKARSNNPGANKAGRSEQLDKELEEGGQS